MSVDYILAHNIQHLQHRFINNRTPVPQNTVTKNNTVNILHTIN